MGTKENAEDAAVAAAAAAAIDKLRALPPSQPDVLSSDPASPPLPVDPTPREGTPRPSPSPPPSPPLPRGTNPPARPGRGRRPSTLSVSADRALISAAVSAERLVSAKGGAGIALSGLNRSEGVNETPVQSRVLAETLSPQVTETTSSRSASLSPSPCTAHLSTQSPAADGDQTHLAARHIPYQAKSLPLTPGSTTRDLTDHEFEDDEQTAIISEVSKLTISPPPGFFIYQKLGDEFMVPKSSDTPIPLGCPKGGKGALLPHRPMSPLSVSSSSSGTDSDCSSSFKAPSSNENQSDSGCSSSAHSEDEVVHHRTDQELQQLIQSNSTRMMITTNRNGRQVNMSAGNVAPPPTPLTSRRWFPSTSSLSSSSTASVGALEDEAGDVVVEDDVADQPHWNEMNRMNEEASKMLRNIRLTPEKTKKPKCNCPKHNASYDSKNPDHHPGTWKKKCREQKQQDAPLRGVKKIIF